MPLPIAISMAYGKTAWKFEVKSGSTITNVAGDPGFEPGLTDPESVVLPLD